MFHVEQTNSLNLNEVVPRGTIFLNVLKELKYLPD